VNAVRVDPKEPGLLFSAAEGNVYVSFDDGAHWQSLQLNLPHTSMRDIIVHGDDLVVATHGRGFWILDNIEPLRELARTPQWSGAHLFSPSLAYRVRRNTNSDTPLPPEEPHGTNPPDGAMIDYVLAGPAARVTISILDARGTLVRRYSSDESAPAPVVFAVPAYWEKPFVKPSVDAGMHRFVWDLHESPPASDAVDLPISANYENTPRVPQGALVVPGRYTVRLDVDGHTSSAPLEIAMDPRVTISRYALEEQYDMAHQTAVLIDRTHAAAAQAHAKENAAATRDFERFNGRLSLLIDLIDGADAPIPEGTRRAFCTLRADASSALGIAIPHDSLCSSV
jgi:hypothetical protein